MNLFKQNDSEIKIVRPDVLGWLEKKLSDKEMEYLWRCIDARKQSKKPQLAGVIHESNVLVDKKIGSGLIHLNLYVERMLKNMEINLAKVCQ